MERATVAKSTRILSVYTQLLNGKTINRTRAAQEFNVTPRSIQRDIEDLRGFFAEQLPSQELIYDPERKGYCLSKKSDTWLSNGTSPRTMARRWWTGCGS